MHPTEIYENALRKATVLPRRCEGSNMLYRAPLQDISGSLGSRKGLPGCRMQGAGCRVQDVGCRRQGRSCPREHWSSPEFLSCPARPAAGDTLFSSAMLAVMGTHPFSQELEIFRGALLHRENCGATDTVNAKV